MKLLLFSDPHITPKAEFSKPTEDGLTEYLHRVQKSFEWICKRIEIWRPDYVCCLGDVFESTGYVDTVSLKVAHELCGQLSRYAKSVDARCIFLVGNHDSYSVEHNQHNLHFLKRYGIIVVDQPQLIDGIYCIPWTDVPKLPKPPATTKVCLSHVDVKGGALYKDYRSDFGYDPEDLPCMTFNGHQHNPCEVWPHFYNVGALLSRNFHDVDSPPRGITIYDVDHGKLVFEVNQHDVPFRDVLIDTPAAAQVWAEKISNAETGLDQAHVRVRYDGDHAAIAEQLTYVTMGARLEEIPRTKVEITSDHVNETFSPVDNFERYVDQVFLFDEEGDRERVLELGLDYIRRVQVSARTHALPIRFCWAHAQGFQSLGDVHVRLSEHGLVYVEGRNEDDPADSNGAGKSSLAEAIYWCLTGESLRGYRGDDVIHWHKDWCKVQVSLFVGDQQYVVERYRRHPEMKNRVVLGVYADEGPTDISCRVTKDTDAKVQELIGRSRDVLRHSVFLSGGLETRFTGLRFPDRIKLIEQITDSDIYGDIFKLVKADTSKAVAEVHTLRGRIEETETAVHDLDRRIKEVMGQIVEQRRNQEQGLSSLKVKLGDALREQGELEKLVEELNQRIEPTAKKRDEWHEKASQVSDRIHAESNDFTRVDTQRESIKQALAEKTKHIMAGVCVSCGQPIEGAPIVDQVEELKNKLRDKIKDCEERKRVILQLKDQQVEAVKGYRDAEGQITVWADERRAADDRLGKLTEDVEQYKRAMERIRSESTDLEAIRRTLKDDRQRWFDKMEETKKALVDAERHLRAMEWLNDAFSTKGIRAKMLATVTVPYLNERLREHSSKFGLQCQLTTQTETKGGDVQDKVDVVLAGNRTYRGCSRGEKRKVDLAVQCALNDLAVATGGGSIDLLVCDEVVDPLDDTSTLAVVDMLKAKAEDMTILLMAHKPFLGDRLPSKWTLVKRNDVTSLEVR